MSQPQSPQDDPREDVALETPVQFAPLQISPSSQGLLTPKGSEKLEIKCKRSSALVVYGEEHDDTAFEPFQNALFILGLYSGKSYVGYFLVLFSWISFFGFVIIQLLILSQLEDNGRPVPLYESGFTVCVPLCLIFGLIRIFFLAQRTKCQAFLSSLRGLKIAMIDSKKK